MRQSSTPFLNSSWFYAAFCLTVPFVAVTEKVCVAQENIGVHVPDGFEVSLYADDDLAHDIYSMTIDSLCAGMTIEIMSG